MKLNKKSQEYTLADLQDWFQKDRVNLDSLRSLHAVLNKKTDTLPLDPASTHTVSRFKLLKLAVSDQIKRHEADLQSLSDKLQARGANLV